MEIICFTKQQLVFSGRQEKRGAEQAIAELCQRLTPLGPNVRLDKAQCTYEVDKIIGDAYRTWSTYVYDQY